MTVDKLVDLGIGKMEPNLTSICALICILVNKFVSANVALFYGEPDRKEW